MTPSRSTASSSEKDSNTSDKHATFTRGSIKETMIKTTLAMLPGTLAMSGYNLADTYYIGKLNNTSSLAAMGFTIPVILLIACLFRGLIVGISTTTAQALGNKQKQKACNFISSGYLLVLFFSILTTIVGILTINPLFSAMNATGSTLAFIHEYMFIWYLGFFSVSLTMTGNDLVIAAGKPKITGFIMMGGMILNAILDPFFIFGIPMLNIPGFNLAGAAWATVISQSACAIVTLYLLYKQQLISLHPIPFRLQKKIWLLIISFAIPSTIGMLMMPIGNFVITCIVAKFNDAAVAAVAAVGRLEMAAFVLPMALGISMLPMIGQNFGAKLYSRIKQCRRLSTRFAFAYLLGIGSLYVLFAEPLSGIFTQDPEVKKIMILSLCIIPWGFWGIEIHRYSGFFFTGCGKPTTTAWLNVIRIIVLMIPFSLIALYFNSLPGLFIARFSADAIAGLLGWILVRQMTRNYPPDGELLLNQQIHSFSYLIPSSWRAIATAQTELDNQSSSQ